jgi:hypothetical protein
MRCEMNRVRTAVTALVTVLMAVLAGAGLSGCSGSASVPEVTSSVSSGAMAQGEASPTAEALPRLSDTGLGELKLGLSLKQARALGAVGKTLSADESELCTVYRGKNGVRNLYFNKDRLVVIDIGPKLKLANGSGIGSTFETLGPAYGHPRDTLEGLGRVYFSAPGAPFKAEYRIALDTNNTFRDSKITEIALQAVDLGCYE